MQRKAIDYDGFIDAIKHSHPPSHPSGTHILGPMCERKSLVKHIQRWGNAGLCPKAITKSAGRGSGKDSYFVWDAPYQYIASHKLWKSKEWNFTRLEVARARFDALGLWEKRDLTEREEVIKALWKKYYEQEISGR